MRRYLNYIFCYYNYLNTIFNLIKILDDHIKRKYDDHIIVDKRRIYDQIIVLYGPNIIVDCRSCFEENGQQTL